MAKIIYIVSEDWYFCSHRLELANTAVANKHEVYVITRVSEHEDKIRNSGINLLPLNLSRSSANPFKEFSAIWQIYRYLRQVEPDIVHNVALKPVLYGTLAARLCKVPITINAFAGMGILFASDSTKVKLARKALKYVCKILLRPTHIIVQNPDDYDIIKNMGLANISLIKGAGVNIQIFKAEPEQATTPLIILPARLLWKKGVGLFVEAARILKKQDVKARFALVGTPDEMNPSSVSQTQLNEWQAEGVVEIWGRRDNMPEVYSQSHIVCLPSMYGEGIPKALIEAASCGKPIITTDMPGCREIVRHNENGFLVKPGSIDELTTRLKMLIEDAELRHRFGLKGREMVEQHFSSDIIIKQTLDLYSRILGVQA